MLNKGASNTDPTTILRPLVWLLVVHLEEVKQTILSKELIY